MTSRVFIAFSFIALFTATLIKSPVVFGQSSHTAAARVPGMMVTVSSKPTPASPKPTPEPNLIPYCVTDEYEYVGLQDACARPRNTIFVIGLASDAATSGKLVATLTDQLQNFILDDGARVIPEPNWGVSDFVAQCKADHLPQHQKAEHDSALVIAAVAIGSGEKDTFTYMRSTSEVALNVLYADCTPAVPMSASELSKAIALSSGPRPIGKPKVRASPSPMPLAYVWSSHIQYGYETKKAFVMPRYLDMIAVLGGVASIYEALAPSKSSSTSATRLFPSPSPLPSSGWISTSTSTSGSATNTGVAALSQNLLAQSIAGSVVVPNIPPDDSQMWNAIEGAVYSITKEMKCPEVKLNANEDVKGFAEPGEAAPFQFAAPFCKKSAKEAQASHHA